MSDTYFCFYCEKNIQKKEKYYSELTFHFWFWKNKLKKYNTINFKKNHV